VDVRLRHWDYLFSSPLVALSAGHLKVWQKQMIHQMELQFHTSTIIENTPGKITLDTTLQLSHVTVEIFHHD